MPFKSILRAMGRHFATWPMSYRPAPLQLGLDRLTSRSDWRDRFDPLSEHYLHSAADPWPATDDPYAKPEPCDVVPDVGKLAIDKLAARGLTGPMPTPQSVTDLITLIERQEAAEKHLKGIGMTYTRERGWHIP